MIVWICKVCNNKIDIVEYDKDSDQMKGDCPNCKIRTIVRPGKIKG